MQLNLFSKVIQLDRNNNHANIEKNLSEQCLKIQKEYSKGGRDWLATDTYNTFNMYDTTQDKVFESLTHWIDTRVNAYCIALKYKNNILSKKGWFNIYKKGDFQEYHTHAESHISTIYCLEGDKKSARIFFKKDTNMFPIPVDEYTPTNAEAHWVPFIPGQLIIFESSLMHSVEKHLCSTLRFSLSYNYCLKE